MGELNTINLGNTIHRVNKFSTSPQLPSIVEFKDFNRDIFTTLTNSDKFDLVSSSRCEEFLAVALVGSPGGDDIAPAIWSSQGQVELYGRINDAKNVFINTIPSAIYFAANNFENVYVLNSSATLMAIKHFPQDSADITNVTTLSWNDAYNDMPQLDLAIVMYGYISSDDQLFESILNALSVRGVLIIQNASNGGSLYQTLGDKRPLETGAQESLSAQMHKKIIDRGDFIVQHTQGWISQTVCVKVGV